MQRILSPGCFAITFPGAVKSASDRENTDSPRLVLPDAAGGVASIRQISEVSIATGDVA
jgi:hypothetical protein